MTAITARPGEISSAAKEKADRLAIRQFAAAAAFELGVKYVEMAMTSDDPEVVGKAYDRVTKNSGAQEDKTSSVPIIHLNINHRGSTFGMTSKKAVTARDAADSGDEVVEAVEVTAQPALEVPSPPAETKGVNIISGWSTNLFADDDS